MDKSGDCWLWTAATKEKGYGAFWDGIRVVRAHRYAFALLVGDIPDGLQLDHLCRNPRCVRPDHLEPVTPGENTRRGNAGKHWAEKRSGTIPLQEVSRATSTRRDMGGIGVVPDSDPMYTLLATEQHGVLSFGWQNSESQGDDVSQGSDAPLRTGTTPAVLAFDALNQSVNREACHTLRGEEGMTGGGWGGILAYDTTQVTSQANRSNPRAGDPCHPLAAGAHAPLVVPIQEVGKRTGKSTTDVRAGVGIGEDGDPMYTLQAGAQHGVVSVTGDITHALTHEGHDASEDGTGRGTPIVVGSLQAADGKSQFFGAQAVDAGHVLIANAVCAREAKGWNPASSVGNGTVSNGIPRRLMPVECERLMSWPDGWTDVPDEKGKPASDAVRYKACGNGVVSNVAEWIGARLLTVHTAAQEAV